MKKPVLLFFGICLFLTQLVYAQGGKKKKPQPKVPQVVLTAFATKYPNLKPTDWDWEPEKETYEADFMQDNKKREAAFTPAGKWLKTKTEITKAELPALVAKAAASSAYGTWQMNEFEMVETADKGIHYKIRFKKGQEEQSLKFDAKGNLIQKNNVAKKPAQKS